MALRVQPGAGEKAGGLAETGTAGFGGKKEGGKGQFLISAHIPLMYYLLFANICMFALYLSQGKQVVVPLSKRLLKLVFGFARVEVPRQPTHSPR